MIDLGRFCAGIPGYQTDSPFVVGHHIYAVGDGVCVRIPWGKIEPDTGRVVPPVESICWGSETKYPLHPWMVPRHQGQKAATIRGVALNLFYIGLMAELPGCLVGDAVIAGPSNGRAIPFSFDNGGEGIVMGLIADPTKLYKVM